VSAALQAYPKSIQALTTKNTKITKKEKNDLLPFFSIFCVLRSPIHPSPVNAQEKANRTKADDLPKKTRRKASSWRLFAALLSAHRGFVGNRLILLPRELIV
jgi:hypothetical protein